MAHVKESMNFSAKELSCNCGECETRMDEGFMLSLELLRIACGFPLHLSSAYRCPTYNNKVSSTGLDGPHTTGKAVDILVSAKKAFTVLEAALPLGFTGIGVSQKGSHSKRFIHLDSITPGSTRPWVWSY